MTYDMHLEGEVLVIVADELHVQGVQIVGDQFCPIYVRHEPFEVLHVLKTRRL